MPRVLVVGAMPGETAALRRRLVGRSVVDTGRIQFACGWIEGQVHSEIYVVHCGVGRRSAQQFAGVLSACEVEFDHLVIVGLCGGLDPALASGDLVVATQLVGEAGTKTDLYYDADLAETKTAAKRGILASSPILLTTPESKQQFWNALDRPKNAVVDMETAYIVAALEEAGAAPARLTSVRAVSDNAYESLPAFLAELDVLNSFQVYLAVAKFLVLDPRRATVLLSLGQKLKVGGVAIADWVEENL